MWIRNVSVSSWKLCYDVVVVHVSWARLSLNCNHQRAYFSSPVCRRVRSPDGIILVGRTRRTRRKTCINANLSTTNNQLKLLPYRFQAVHQLQQCNTAARIQYWHWFHAWRVSCGNVFKWNILHVYIFIFAGCWCIIAFKWYGNKKVSKIWFCVWK